MASLITCLLILSAVAMLVPSLSLAHTKHLLFLLPRSALEHPRESLASFTSLLKWHFLRETLFDYPKLPAYPLHIFSISLQFIFLHGAYCHQVYICFIFFIPTRIWDLQEKRSFLGCAYCYAHRNSVWINEWATNIFLSI